jgi:thiol-disulfide isomerase/thioredoxin
MFKKLLVSVLLAAVPFVATCAPLSFELKDTAGTTHSLESHRGKWVLLNLWATWCAPCVSEMPELESLSKAHSDLVVIGLAVDGRNSERIRQFAEKLHVSYPIVAGDTDMTKQFKPRGYPTSLLFDGSGNLVFVKQGAITQAEVELAILR